MKFFACKHNSINVDNFILKNKYIVVIENQ